MVRFPVLGPIELEFSSSFGSSSLLRIGMLLLQKKSRYGSGGARTQLNFPVSPAISAPGVYLFGFGEKEIGHDSVWTMNFFGGRENDRRSGTVADTSVSKLVKLFSL